MVYRGHVQNGVVVIDDAEKPPEGAAVRVETVGPEARQTLVERLRPVIGSVSDLPVDMAEHHDHYIHGTPKP